MENKILSMTGINKIYGEGDMAFQALFDVNFHVNSSEFVSILGPSGSGKSTLMNIIGCLDTATSGEYVLDGTDIKNMTEDNFAQIRNKKIGFVFQNFQLLKRQSALDNVMLPLIYSGVKHKRRVELAEEVLVAVGLQDKMKSRPNQLSGGQQQRVSIARALVTNPTILLADEPTGALDQKTGYQIMDLFGKLHQNGKSVVMITHNEEIANTAERVVKILDGRLYNKGEL